MNNLPQQSGPLLPLDKVIRPPQIQNLVCLTQEQKVQYHSGVSSLWKRIQDNQAPDNPERMQAHRSLSDLSHRLRMLMIKHKQGQQGQQGQQAVQASGMQQQGQPPRPNQQAMEAQATAQSQMAARQAQAIQAQAQAAAQSQHAQSGAQAATQSAQVAAAAAANSARPGNVNQPMDFSDRVKEQARALNVLIPVPQKSRPQDELQRYVNNEKRKYAQLLAAFELRNQHLTEFQQSVQVRQRQKPFTPEEQQQLQSKLSMMRDAANTAKCQAIAFKRSREEGIDQQQALREVQAQQQQVQQQQQQARKNAQAQQQQQNQQASTTVKQPPQQPKTAQSPVKKEEAKAGQAFQEIKTEPTESSEAKIDAGRKPSITTNVQTQAPPQAQNSSTAANVSVTNAAPAPTKGPATGQQSPTTGPVPLSREEAVVRAYAQSAQQGAQAQSATTPVQNIQRESSTQAAVNANRKLDRPLNVAPLQAVPMPAARPSLTGGPQMMGPMGQPAIQKPPTYNLEGDGERVLSKKKLEDLVRIVTGGVGGEGVEMLDPDVEEVLLDVADEFVDNVITSACRLAKLRGGNSLELRDIQIVLERNYNIRVPGFASDELRTVKKIQPTQAWTQKMSAVQAAKVTGGKTDL